MDCQRRNLHFGLLDVPHAEPSDQGHLPASQHFTGLIKQAFPVLAFYATEANLWQA